MTKAEIAQQYEIDEDGVITSPGKFEMEMYYAVSYWGDALDRFASNETWNECGVQVAVFDLNKQDHIDFPELEGCSELKIWEDDNGFVYCTVE